MIAKRVLEPVPHVRTLRDSVSVPMEQALLRALAKTPADRFATAGEFARALSTPVVTQMGTGSVATAPPSERTLRRHWRVAAGLAAIVLLGLGMLFAWRKNHRPDEAGRRPGPTRLAVLPFENLGRPEDEYFADGVTDEVRGKLAGLPGLEVIARASSSEYKRTTKRPQQIGRELGVDYLLTGTVRWEKKTGGPSRVRVSPELVQVSTPRPNGRHLSKLRSPMCSGAGRRGRPRGRGARPRAPRRRARAARRAPHPEPRGLRRLPSRRGSGRRARHARPRRAPAGESTTTNGR